MGEREGKQGAVRLGGMAFLPLIVFLVLYVGCGLAFTALGAEDAFSKFPRHVALLAGVAAALALAPSVKLSERWTCSARGWATRGS